MMSKDSSVILLTADLGFGAFECFEPFRNKQYFNVGISEQMMASMAAGLSIEGFKVFIYSIGIFPTFRCLEQIRNDISYHDCAVTIISTGAGFSYGSLGMTHHCVQDIGVMKSIPNVNIYTPSNKFEMGYVLDGAKDLSYIRIDKSTFESIPIISDHKIFCYGYFINERFRFDQKTLILAHGSIGSIVKPFMNDEYAIDFYTLALIKESDKIVNLCKKYKKIITIEEHSFSNGFFSFISSLLAKHKILKEMDYLSLPDEHISLVGDQKYLREKLNLNSQTLKKKL